MESTPILKIFQDITILIKDFGSLGTWVLSLFGIPEMIKIRGTLLSTAGLFTAILTIIGFFMLSRIFSDYIKYIAIGAGVIFFLSLLSAILGG